MIYYFLTIYISILMMCFYFRKKILDFKHQYTLVIGALLYITLFSAIILISFRIIEYRGDVIYGGTDAPAYKSLFELANTDYLQSLIVQFYEPGYASIVWFFSRYINSYEIFQVFIYLFLYFSIFKFVNFIRTNLYIFITLFLLNSLIVSSMNTLRVTISIFISLYIYKYLNKEKYSKALLISLIAISIHTSAVILLPVIFFSYVFNKYSVTLYSVLQFIFFIAVSVFSFKVLPLMLSGTRLDEYTTFNEGAFSFNTFIVSAIIIFLVFNRYSEFVKYNSYNASLISTLPTIFSVMPIFYNYSIGYRFLMYFLPIIFALLPSVFFIYKVKKINDLYFYPLIFSLYCYFLIKVFNFFFSEIKHSEIYEFNDYLILFS